MKTRTDVDFSYAFSAPHRLCICMPESSRKSLVDVSATGVTLSWSDGDLTTHPLGAFKSPRTDWVADFTAEAEGHPMQGTRWNRVENWIPAMEYCWQQGQTRIELTAVAAAEADISRFQVRHDGAGKVKAGVYAKSRKMTVNARWIDFDAPHNVLLGHEGERPDRMVLLATGMPLGRLHSMSNLDMEWELGPGECQTAFVLRPHFALIDDVETWLSRDWEDELRKALNSWSVLLSRAPSFKLPDAAVTNAYKAGLADIFVMREAQADGRVAGTAGTEVYRAANTAEPCFQSIVLNRTGYFKEAREGIEFVTQFQEKDGNWEDARQWGHHMWATSGFKSWAVREHYHFTHDRSFLAENFERMLASARWSQKQREKTKVSEADGNKPLTWGLMPRGLGDCGLMDDDDLFGVFYPHNFWHCLGLEIAAWAAEELGRTEVRDELQGYHEDLYQCLMDSLKYGAIAEADGSRWIPGTPCKTSGSRWGVAEAVMPCRILSPHDPLADGTMARLEREMSEGGLPMNLGWLKGGLWVAIALDAISYAHMIRGESDHVADYLYATLNHGTPLFTWCEERLPEKDTTTITGDLQHAWTPISVARIIRDILLMEEDSVLHIARAVPRWWLEPGREIRVDRAPTHWGEVDYRLSRQEDLGLVLNLRFKGETLPAKVILHLRVPEGVSFAVAGMCGGSVRVEGEQVVLEPDAAEMQVELKEC